MKIITLISLLTFSTFSSALSVFSMNLHCGLDDWESRMDMVVDEIVEMNPDVIGLQEVCYNDEMNMTKYIGDSLAKKGYPVKSLLTIDTHRSFLRYQEQLLLISRHPSTEAKSGKLPGPGVLRNGFVSFRVGNQRFLTTHLHFALPAIRRSQYEFLAKEFANQAVIIFGDMNSSPQNSETDVLKKSSWVSFFDGPTYPSNDPVKTFDGFWMSEKFHQEVMATTIERVFLNQRIQPSDHLGISLSILKR